MASRDLRGLCAHPYNEVDTIAVSTLGNISTYVIGVTMQQNKLYVGNFPYSVDETQLREMFSAYGDIQDIALIKDRETGRSKGFAFITFASQQAAEKALALNGKEVEGRALKVNMAQEKESRGGRGGGGGRSRW
jgi:RNA recognition motif-containing protein